MNITFDNVSFKYNKPILSNVSFTFEDNKKTGLVGVNGSGKSTILKLINGLEKPNSGEVIISGNSKINYLEQDPKFPDCTIINLFKDVENEYEVKSILNKFKLFNHEALCNNLSGGEKKRLALAHTLLKKCDMLILDEPTNHLDIDMILFLEKFLTKWNKGLILITHDRYFLDVVCNQIIELRNCNVVEYNANYSKYLELKIIKEQELIKEEMKHKKLFQEESAWASRQPKARTTKSKSRLERFEQLKDKTFVNETTIEFNSNKTRIGKKLIEIENGYKKFDKVLFENFNLSLLKSDIVGVVGNNGCGKSTLFKIIMGLDTLDSGTITLGETLKIGYLKQELDILDNEITLVEYFGDNKENVTNLLLQFNFNKDMHYQKIKTLSGGEKRRLQLIKVLHSNPNLLILDEPTNDLDIATLDALEDYLDSFIGPVLLVSHDRFFLDNICNKLCIYENNNITVTNESYSDYLSKAITLSNKPKGDTRLPKNKMSAKDRNLLDELENTLPVLEDKLKELKLELSKLSTEYTKIIEVSNEIETLSEQIDQKTNKYFELLELKESL